MTTKAKEKQRQEKGPVNKYYKPTRYISWIEIIPKYISPRKANVLSFAAVEDMYDVRTIEARASWCICHREILSLREEIICA
jgi:hypothetical protein